MNYIFLGDWGMVAQLAGRGKLQWNLVSKGGDKFS